MRYQVIYPTNKRKRFTIVCYTSKGRVKTYHPVKQSLLDAIKNINQQFQSNFLGKIEATTLIKKLISEEHQRTGVQDYAHIKSSLSKVNQRVFVSFWVDVYENKYIVDHSSARKDYQKALRMIEPLSILTATQGELQKQLRDTGEKINAIRRASARINTILKYLGRKFTLNKPQEEYFTPDYITLDDFYLTLQHFDNEELKDMALVLFATGLRLGECLALTERDFIPQTKMLYVAKQLDLHGKIKNPKRNSKGKVLVLDFGVEALQRWLKKPDKNRFRYLLYDQLARAGRRAFPDDATKWMGCHDLRHSHAIHLLSKGATLSLVALQLRNGIGVCQKYYTGFSHSDESLNALQRLV